MRAVFILFFVIVLSWLQTGRSLEFVLKQKSHKRAIKLQLRPFLTSFQTKTFLFTESQQKQILWIHAKEFEYNGKMYDVLEKESINEMLKLRCIEDAVEKELIRKYAEENSDNNPFSKSQWKKFSFDCLQNDSLSIPLYFEDTVFEVPTYRKKKNKPYLDRQKKPPENSFNRS